MRRVSVPGLFMANEVTILDCTLRDGSYVVRQQFTAADTARIGAALEAGGVREIEIGHGFGLGAAGPRLGIPAASDEEHLAAAARTLRKARFGMFYIPGVGSTAHLDMAREHGMHFVRIGTNVHQYQVARPHIEHARRIGLRVSYNAMKSYLVGPTELLVAMRDTVAWGAQEVSIVDSAGALIPTEVKAYAHLLASEIEVPIGFHGHNNLMLANANCLAAWEAGATLFDGTLQGIGRSGGNAQTEILALMFEKMNIQTGLNVRHLLDAGERLIRPLMGADGGGATSLNVVIGMAAFHSTFLDRVKAVAERFDVDLKDLILAVSELDRVDPSSALIEQAAADLARRSGSLPGSSVTA
ncbi:MAG TPA: 4-hydroxy-2-oxovalerate aldolase [Terriglobia bacterium]|nr:4-hydroxy-2-oxovalerate aldolase [Terriglobia bacterium]